MQAALAEERKSPVVMFGTVHFGALHHSLGELEGR